jgi:putative ABC transport system permease protein
MFFLTYLRRELRRRMRQAVFIALGLALGIGLVITVIGAASGVKAAQAKVLQALYGIGTDVTVTTKPQQPAGVKPISGNATSGGPGAGGGGPRAEICLNGKCYTSGTVDALVLGDTGALSAAEVTQIARLRDVSAAAGGLMLTDNRVVLPSAANPDIQPPTSFTVDGTDISHPRLGPLSNARLTSGRTFTAADTDSDVALVDAAYAASHGLKAGSKTVIGGTKFTVIGLVSQPEASSPPDEYIPLARRVPEFGTLKALGWRSSRIVSQVLGESVGTGIIGGLAGVGLGFAGVAAGRVVRRLAGGPAAAGRGAGPGRVRRPS